MKEDSISKSELKVLTKFVLNEIAPVRTQADDAFELLNAIFRGRDNSPILNDINIAMDASKKLIQDSAKELKLTIASIVKHESKEEERKHIGVFLNSTDTLVAVVASWAKKIDSKDNTKRNSIHKIMEKIRTHIEQISEQAKQTIEDVRTYGNYINAINKIKHLNEIFDNLQSDSNELFKLAISVGLGKTNIK